MVTRQGLVDWATEQTRDYNQLCQALVWQACKAFGAAPKVYASARAARLATKIVSTDASKAPLGAIGFWLLGAYDHVAIGLGGDSWLMGSIHAAHYLNAKTHVGYAGSVEFHNLAGATWVGWGYGDGENTITVTPDLPPAPGPTQRLAVALGANGRTAPTRSEPIAGHVLGKTLGTFTGYRTDGENVSGISTWLLGIDNLWYWAGGFEDTGTHDLTDLTPVVAPPTEPTDPVVPPTPTPPVTEPTTPVTEPVGPVDGSTAPAEGGTTDPPTTPPAEIPPSKPVQPTKPVVPTKPKTFWQWLADAINSLLGSLRK